MNAESPRTIAQLHAEMMAADPGCALRRLVRSGEIRSCRVGQKYLVTPAAVADFLSGNRPAVPLPGPVNGIRRIV